MTQSNFLLQKRQRQMKAKLKTIKRSKLRAEKISNYYNSQLTDNFDETIPRTLDTSTSNIDHIFYHDDISINFNKHDIRRKVSLSIEINNNDIITKNILWLDVYQHIFRFCDIFDLIKLSLSCSHLYNFIMNSSIVSFENALKITNKFHLTKVIYKMVYQNPKLIIKLDSIDYFSRYYSRYNEYGYDRMEILLLDIEFHRNYIRALINEDDDRYLIICLKYGNTKVRFNSYIVQRILIEEYGISQQKIENIISSILCLEFRISTGETNSVVVYSNHILRSLLMSLSFKSNNLINYKKKYIRYTIKEHINAYFIDLITFTTFYCIGQYRQYSYEFIQLKDVYNLFYVVTINNIHYYSTNNAIIYTNNLTNADIWNDIYFRFQVEEYNINDMCILYHDEYKSVHLSSEESNGVHLSFTLKPELVQDYLCRCGLLSLLDTVVIKHCPSYYTCNNKKCQCFYKEDLGKELTGFCILLDIVQQDESNYDEWLPFDIEKKYMCPQEFIAYN